MSISGGETGRGITVPSVNVVFITVTSALLRASTAGRGIDIGLFTWTGPPAGSTQQGQTRRSKSQK